MATKGQIDYIKELIIASEIKGIEVPVEIKEQALHVAALTNKEAAEIINDLKFELGWRDNE